MWCSASWHHAPIAVTQCIQRYPAPSAAAFVSSSLGFHELKQNQQHLMPLMFRISRTGKVHKLPKPRRNGHEDSVWIYFSAGFLYKGKTDFASGGVCVQSLAYVWLARGHSKQILHNPGIFIWWCSYPTAPPKKKKKNNTQKKKKNIPRNETSSLCNHPQLALKLATHYIPSGNLT